MPDNILPIINRCGRSHTRWLSICFWLHKSIAFGQRTLRGYPRCLVMNAYTSLHILPLVRHRYSLAATSVIQMREPRHFHFYPTSGSRYPRISDCLNHDLMSQNVSRIAWLTISLCLALGQICNWCCILWIRAFKKDGQCSSVASQQLES